jgi:hypothetical protein
MRSSAGFQGNKSNSIRFEGAEQIQAAIASLPQRVADKHLSAAMEKAVRPMRALLMANTPIGPTGNLRAAVDSKVVFYPSGVAFGVVGYKRAVSEDTSDNKGYHSHLIEFGAADRRPTSGPFLSSQGISGWRPPGWRGRWPMVARYVRGTRAQHPLRRAYEATSSACLGILLSEMQNALSQAVDEASRSGGG